MIKNFDGVEIRGRKVRLELTEPHKKKYTEKKKERFYSTKGHKGNRDCGGKIPASGNGINPDFKLGFGR
ncbi:MAG: hypothetical protein HWD62_08395 [Cyclobacteriaceae bacterium]|nr:MAG: hypothetical protein HWD62_08395 [Cyclobacteriaceae bacterium]